MSGLRPKAFLIWSRRRSQFIIFQSDRMFSLAESVLKHLFHRGANVFSCFAILFMNLSLNCCESSHGPHKVLIGVTNWWRKLETFPTFYMTKFSQSIKCVANLWRTLCRPIAIQFLRAAQCGEYTLNLHTNTAMQKYCDSNKTFRIFLIKTEPGHETLTRMFHDFHASVIHILHIMSWSQFPVIPQCINFRKAAFISHILVSISK